MNYGETMECFFEIPPGEMVQVCLYSPELKSHIFSLASNRVSSAKNGADATPATSSQG